MKANVRTLDGDQAVNNNEEAVEQLEDIKRLLVLLLMKCGSTQDEIGRALDINQRTVGRQFPIGEVKPFIVEVAPTEDE